MDIDIVVEGKLNNLQVEERLNSTYYIIKWAAQE